MRLRRIDIRGGEFTYGARIALGEIFADESLTEYQRAKAAWRELYGWDAGVMPPLMRARAFKGMLEAFAEWVRREQVMLAYTPTADETAAGYEAFCKRIGAGGTVYALAKAFGVDPDEVLKWKYAKVFGILYHDLEELKFGRAYDKVITSKHRRF